MTKALKIALLALAAGSAPAFGAGEGSIDTLERGKYACEMPGDAATQRGIPAPEENFTITNGSAYDASGKRGAYLRIGNMVTMTSGPKKGDRYTLKSGRFLRKLGRDGKPSGLRCILQR
jgi:hypothetical protein